MIMIINANGDIDDCGDSGGENHVDAKNFWGKRMRAFSCFPTRLTFFQITQSKVKNMKNIAETSASTSLFGMLQLN